VKTIDRYVCVNFLFSYAAVLAAFLGLAVVIDASMKLGDFLDQVPKDLPTLSRLGRVATVLFYWYSAQVPLYFRFLMPVITVVSAVVTVVMMKRRNEFVPLLASGVSVYRALGPLMVLALLVSFLGALNQEFLLPGLANRIVRSPSDPHGRKPRPVNQVLLDTAGRQVTADKYLPAEQTMLKVHIDGPPPAGATSRPASVAHVFAEEARWDPVCRAWRLSHGWTEPRDPQTGALLPREPFGPGRPTPSLLFSTSIRPGDVDKPAAIIPMASRGELLDRLRVRPDQPRLRVELHGRLVGPLHAVILLLLGLPLVLLQESRSVIVGIMISVVICLTYLGVQFVSEQLGSTGTLSPVLAVWLPIFVFGPVAAILFDSVKT
jgi:lipopolysaccharide export system permease protein